MPWHTQLPSMGARVSAHPRTPKSLRRDWLAWIAISAVEKLVSFFEAAPSECQSALAENAEGERTTNEAIEAKVKKLKFIFEFCVFVKRDRRRWERDGKEMKGSPYRLSACLRGHDINCWTASAVDSARRIKVNERESGRARVVFLGERELDKFIGCCSKRGSQTEITSNLDGKRETFLGLLFTRRLSNKLARVLRCEPRWFA